ncbi:MAG: hypothetical protein LBS96_00175 [Oscillospiraceae bacterium]|jgi:hypothetical protein|nr:hypothetical protein [Oscillospiraceae bacterium]
MKRKRVAQVLLALVVIAAGVFLAVDRLTRFDLVAGVLGWWPLLLTVAAVLWMVHARLNYCNTFLLGFSGLLLLYNNGLLLETHERFSIATGAYVLVLLGVWLLIGALRPRKTLEAALNCAAPPPNNDAEAGYTYTAPPPRHGKADSSPSFDYFDILGSGHHISLSRSLTGGRVTAVLGSSEVDLTQVEFSRPVTIYASAILGNVTVYTPPHVRVELRGTHLLGSCNADAIAQRPYDPAHPVLTVQNFTLCGDIEIK